MTRILFTSSLPAQELAKLLVPYIFPEVPPGDALLRGVPYEAGSNGWRWFELSTMNDHKLDVLPEPGCFAYRDRYYPEERMARIEAVLVAAGCTDVRRG